MSPILSNSAIWAFRAGGTGVSRVCFAKRVWGRSPPRRACSCRTISAMKFRKTELRERFYPPQFRGMYDRFSDVIHQYVREGDVMLDAGCGSGRVFQYRFDAAQRPDLIFGVDVTTEPRANGNIDAAARADLAYLPFND